MKTKLKFLFAFLLLISLNISSQTQKAIYKVTFNSVWNSTDHGTLPGNAHWSRLVGATHKTKGAFLEIGKLATTGIKNIAETGSNTVFNNEVNTTIINNEANQYINGSSLGSATGNVVINDLEVNKDYPLLTLVSMIAPSPDWIIAIDGVELLDTNGNWKSSINIDLFAIDAGTDNGTSYTATNSATTPSQNISSLVSIAPFNNKKIGTLTIELDTTLTTKSEELISSKIKTSYNQSSKKVIIESTDIKIKNVTVYSTNGSLIKFSTPTSKQTLISFKIQTNGVYFVRIKTNKGIIIDKKILAY